MHTKPASQSGFSLIELLAIIVVIMILMSVLLPFLRSAGELNRKVVCTSNLRQMSIGLALYVNETRYYPGHVDWNDEYNGPAEIAVWPTRISS